MPVVATTAQASSSRPQVPYATHGMVYLDAPFAFKEAMFRESARMGASFIRVDVAMSGVISDPHVGRIWREVDDLLLLARRYRIRPLGVLLATPPWLADCPADVPGARTYICAASDTQRYGHYAGEIAQHTAGVIDHWEIVNEPDGSWAFRGTAETYAAMLAACSDHIKRANPRARVLLGGMIDTSSRVWLARALDAGAAGKFDIANVHIRGTAKRAVAQVHVWRRFFARRGFDGPLWVTEFGYPSETAYQNDPRYRGGEQAQAAYLADVLPALHRAGAQVVFATLRDNLDGGFASEGLLGGNVSDPPSATPKVRRKLAVKAFEEAVRRSARPPHNQSR